MRLAVPRRALAAAIALALAGGGLSGCDRSDAGAVRVTVIGESPSMADPAAGELSAPQSVLLASVAQGLVRFDARGQIEPGLAERWNVTDDGLSYIFRLQPAEWPSGGKVTAHQVARLLRRQLASRSRNPLKDSLGAVAEIVPMTERVLEIRLRAPRPNLLRLLAQPEMAIIRDGEGTGPFRIGSDARAPAFILERTVSLPDDEESRREQVVLAAAAAPDAVRAFLAGKTDLLLGGTFADLPYARAEDMPRGALRFDPASGLFGLVPARADGPAADVELRRLLAQAIDRQVLVDAFDVPGLLPRATVLEPGLDGLADPSPPPWATVPIAERRAELAAAANAQFGDLERPVVAIALPDAPGAELMLNRLASDWAVLGIKVERAGPDRPADLQLIDSVAPSTSPAWYLRRFRCGQTPVCSEEMNPLLDGARSALAPAERYTLLAQAAALVDDQQLFIALAAPIRWSLVSDRVPGFAPNRFARHTLAGLGERLNRERAE
ncbi:MAG TPA: ABC transporter substrate-binding protein [Sphingomicrobium sp.]|nr:ABC transporter substrate-binding protein [Sphingomicrobium sp.]